jgi:hypothetical protein
VEDNAVIEALASQEDKAIDRLRRAVGLELDRDRPVIGVEGGGVTLSEIDRQVRGAWYCFAISPP